MNSISTYVLSSIRQIWSFIPIKIDPKILVVSTLAGLIFAKLAHWTYHSFGTHSVSVKRAPSVQSDKVITLLLRRAGFTLRAMRDRVEGVIDHWTQKEPKVVRGSEIELAREEIKKLSIRTIKEIPAILPICKQYSSEHLDFALYQAFYSGLTGNDEDLEALEPLSKLWKDKGYIISLSNVLDESFVPFLRKYRDCLLLYAPYIAKKRCEEQVEMLIQFVGSTIGKDDPETAVNYLEKFLLPLFSKEGLSMSHPIIKALVAFADDQTKEGSDQLYVQIIFPILEEKVAQTSPLVLKLKDIIYRQMCLGASLMWLKSAHFAFIQAGHPLYPLRDTLLNGESGQTALLEALFSNEQGMRESSIRAYLNLQMMALLKDKPSRSEPLYTTLGTWNETQPRSLSKVEPKVELYTYYLRDIKGNFALSFLTFRGNSFHSIAAPVFVSDEDLKKDLGDKYLSHRDLDKHLLQKSLQALPPEQMTIRSTIEQMLKS